MINWLHISDLHLGSEGTITNMMRDELPIYLKGLGVKCDYVFCTGDIRTANVNPHLFTDCKFKIEVQFSPSALSATLQDRREKIKFDKSQSAIQKNKGGVSKCTPLFLCTKPRLSQAGALLLPKDFVSLSIRTLL